MYHSIVGLVKRKNADLSKDSIKYLNKLASKFARAIDNRRGGVKLSDMGAMGDEREENKLENVDIDSNERYARRIEYSNDESGEQITLEDVKVLREISQDGKRKSINDFSSGDIQKAEKWAKKFYKELGEKSPFFRAWFGDWREYDINKVNVVKHNPSVEFESGKIINADTNKTISWGRDIRGETKNHVVGYQKSLIALDDIKTIVTNAIYFDTVVSRPTSKSKMPNTAFMHSLYSLYEHEGKIYLLKLFVEEALSNNETTIFSRAYQLKGIEKVADVPNSVLFQEEGLTDDTSTTTYSISDLFKIVKQYDKNFNPKPVNPLLLNEDGTPKVLYHGTNAEFFEFDKIKIRVDNLGKGFYLVDNKEIANSYATKRTEERGGTSKVMEVYLKTEKPLHTEKLTREDVRSFYTYQYMQDGESYEEAIKEAEEDLNYAETTGKNKGWFDGDYSSLVATSDGYFKEWAISEGYDCFIVPGQDKRTGIDGTAFVVFESNQIKSATDNIGTFDRQNPDIRYSRRTTGDALGIDFIKDKDGRVRITTNDLEIAQNIEKKRRNNSNEAKLEVAEEQRKESLRGLIGEKVIEEVSASDEVTRLRKYIADNMYLKKYDSNLMMLTKRTK